MKTLDFVNYKGYWIDWNDKYQCYYIRGSLQASSHGIGTKMADYSFDSVQECKDYINSRCK